MCQKKLKMKWKQLKNKKIVKKLNMKKKRDKLMKF